MSFAFRPAKRERVPLLLGLAGGTGSGKTMSALLLARGISGGHPIVAVDTENGRMNHYADLFPELHVGQITAPFRPDRYTEAIEAAEKHLVALNVPLEHRVVVVDSASHEWYGDGGCLDWHDDLMGGNQAKNLSAWIEPKKAHKRMVSRLLRMQSHVILCFRAEPKVESVQVQEDGRTRTKIIAKASLTGLDGWIPIAEKNLPFELTASFLLMADRPGVPKPIKLQEQHRTLVPLDRPLTPDVGVALAAWAAGGDSGATTAPEATQAPAAAPAPAQTRRQPITEAQARRLNVQVGQLRQAQRITTEHVYTAVSRLRGIDLDQAVAQIDGARDESGELHWGPLRETLSKQEAGALIDRLAGLEAEGQAA